MTDIETLRAALHETPSETFAQPDLAAIMATGTRIRRRRRLAAGGGVAAVAVAVVAVVFGATQLRAPAPDVASPPGPALSTSASTSPSFPPLPKPLGTIVDTGISDAKGELVIYGTAIDDSALPQTHFGMELAYRDAAGKLAPVLAINEFKGSDRSPGFHQVTGGDSTRDGAFLPVVGYFAGPVAKITSTVHGKTVKAGLAQWSEDPQVTFLWFTPQDVPDHNLMTPPLAYDASGNRLTK